jgi:hypothetical protein
MQLHLGSGAQTCRNVTSHKQSKPLARFIGYNLLRYKYCCEHACRRSAISFAIKSPLGQQIRSIKGRNIQESAWRSGLNRKRYTNLAWLQSMPRAMWWARK